ncbi:hypothetical protein [Blastopirellula marina]|uniref:Uncharacterized protein n=1 Tax=Blastopirellula marina TaxID=124 RepID=A0A2S8GC85_9BACT|nr:hypothetical protein [Blastopirellula marina]PQO42076.1 hypothetical protein C5Y93_27385 [Blastopirellula marina]
MNAQIAQVLRTYYRRPLVLLLAAVALLLAVILLLLGMYRTMGGLSIAPGFSFWGNRSLFVSNITPYDTQSNPPLEIDYLHVNDWGSDPPVDLTPFQNATILQYSSDDFTSERLREIDSMEKLDALSLRVNTLPADTFAVLGPKLTTLQIPSRLLSEHADELTQLDRLTLLRIERSALDEATMSVVAKIPNLQTLVLTHSVADSYAPKNSLPSKPLTWDPAAFAPLRNHPNLNAIFVDWFYPESRTIAELPGVVLYHATTSWQRDYSLYVALFLSAAISILVTLQIWVHFTSQHSVIIPGYHRPHQVVAVSILLGGSLVVSLLLWHAEVAWLPALALALGLPALLIPILVGMQSPARHLRAVSIFLSMVAGVMIWIPWMITKASPTMAGEAVWFFEGKLWLWTAALLLLEGVLLVIGISSLPKLARQAYERSAIHPGLSPWDPQQKKRTAYGATWWWMKFWDLKSFPSLADGSFWQKAKLWRLGNGYRPLLVTFAMGLTFFVIALVLGFLSQRSITQQPIFYSFTIQFGVMLMIMPLPIWYKRCSRLQIESLRPVGRSDMTRQLFGALAADQLWALPILVVAMGFSLYQFMESYPVRPWAMLPLPFILWLWFYSLGTSVFTIRRVWVLATYIVTMSVISFVIPITTLTVMAVNEVSFDAIAQMGYVFDLGLLAAAVIVVRTTYQRAVNREWGL